ncbi:hypothetical protein BT96DRAFT_912371 [Gymnopus androsaceus JB14]|uniref:Uncharacterized protein n=1 Tax=Gymnopus androsaceus JB14 TaxID=1447944 RepID=A0A6A4ISS6_9AGAR|nr:hypothetical protein BT96DRAFT_912371 [Gymnopus androsaceus JB14]
MEAEASRPALAPSYSFSGSSSTTAVMRPLKRTLTSTCDLEFFKPAESSFNPRPYTPSANPPSGSSHSRNKYTQLARQSNRSEAHVILSMDPSPTDPNAVFIHPPFTDFPDAQNLPEGLTYKAMMDNPNWFLDAADYLRIEDNPPNAPVPVDNTSSLIPYPSYLEPPRGWCPAKKKDLKDAGSEGRSEGEEPRLRCTFCRRTYAGPNAKSMWRRHVFEKHRIAMSNRRDGGDRPRGRGSMKENKHDKKSSSGEETHDNHKIRFRPAIVGDPMHSKTPAPPASAFSETQKVAPSNESTSEQVSFTPPLTPLKSSSVPASGSNDVPRPRTPPLTFASPYDPRATPAFPRDLSLSVLLRNSGSLSVGSSSPIPSLMQDDHSSPDSSLISKKSFFVDLDTPESVANKRFPGLKSSVSSRRADESPLSLIGRSHQRTISDLSLDGARNIFLSDWEIHSSPSVAGRLIDPAAESPVVRRGISLDNGGLGIGLLEPFTLPENRDRAHQSSSDIEDEFEIMDDLTNSHSISDSDHLTPPPKKRKTSL